MFSWRMLTHSNHPKYLVKGTELEAAIVPGHNSRFQIVSVRAYDADMNSCELYYIRDSHTVSDADIAAGKRPLIVFRSNNFHDCLSYCNQQQ